MSDRLDEALVAVISAASQWRLAKGDSAYEVSAAEVRFWEAVDEVGDAFSMLSITVTPVVRCELCGHDMNEHGAFSDCNHEDKRTRTGYCGCGDRGRTPAQHGGQQ